MRIFFCRAWMVWVLGVCCCLRLVLAQDSTTISSIKVEHVGPPAASEALIRANIRVEEGDPYAITPVNDDVKNLLDTGLFYDVRVVEERTGEGVELTYVLQGKPTLTGIRFEGNEKFSDRKLRKLISSEVGQPLDERKLFMDSQAIEERYQKKGYQRTEVSYTPVIDPNTGRGTAVFEIEEAPKIKIERVEFVGAEAFTQRKLRKEIKTRRWWWLSWLTGSGVLKDDQFQEDKAKLAQFYFEHGYLDFEIKDVEFDQISENRMIIRFFVFEGKQYHVGNVDITGNSLFTDEEIREGLVETGRPLRLTAGTVFNPVELRKDIVALEDFYGARGYIDTWVRVDQRPNVETGTIDLVYEIRDEDKGKSYVEKIEIRGNVKTKDKVIRRELAVAPGEVFDMVRVKRSKRRLEQMGYFDRVEAEDEATEIPNRKNLVIDVEEASTGNFEVGAGFSSVDSLVGFVGYREGNFDLFNPPWFRGGGQKLRISVQLGTRRRDFVITFIEPWFLERKLAFQTDLYHKEINYYSDLYDLTQTGAKVGLKKALGTDFLIGGVSYTIENIGLSDVDPVEAPKLIRDEPGNRLVTKFGGSIAYDTRNSVELPDAGQRTELETELAGPFGGDTDFYKLELRTAWYFSVRDMLQSITVMAGRETPEFFDGHVLEARARGGVADNYGRTDRVPLFDRYFLGGVYTLRGYRFRDVGPHDLTVEEPIGGETFWFASVEYSIPIIERLRFALFYDIGNVYADAYSFDLSPGQVSYYDNWGLGIRLNIPRLGPLRLDYAFPLSHDEFTGDSGRFQFSVGFTSDF